MPNERMMRVRVTTRSSKPRVEAAEGGGYNVYVSCVPEKGKANAAVIKALAQHLGVPPSALEVTGGHKSRDKMIRVRT